MSFLNMFLLSFLISTASFIDYALALHGESLVSNNFAEMEYFNYQVAIMGKKNGTRQLELVCSAAILADHLILAAAQCFIDEVGYHTALTFIVIAGKVDLLAPGGTQIYIEQIYLPYAGSYYLGNIAVAELAQGLGIHAKNSPLRAIEYVGVGETFWGINGTVAGYGHHVSTVMYSYLHGKELLVETNIDYKLRYGIVQILTSRDCSVGQAYVNFADHFCVKMFLSAGRRKAGICRLDAGSPLVINDRIVAVANTNHLDCNDAEIGGLYTGIENYVDFIDNIMLGTPLSETVIYQNRPHHLH